MLFLHIEGEDNMKEITNIEDLKEFLKDNIVEEALFTEERTEGDKEGFENYQRGFESGYSNAYANLLATIDEEFRVEWAQRNTDYETETIA